MLKQNELARRAIDLLADNGINATLSDILEVEDNTPLVAAVMTSGLVASGMKGLLLTDNDLSPVDYDILIRASRGIHSGDSWIRGDLMNHIRMTEYNGGDIPKQALDAFAFQMGVSPKRLQNNMTTCAAWELSDRYDSSLLSHTHHEVLAPLDVTVRAEWAERCISEGISVNTLRVLLSEEANAVDPDPQPKTIAAKGDPLDLNACIEVMYKWFSNEVIKTNNSKTAFENTIHSYIDNGLLHLPDAKWRAVQSQSQV